MATSPNRQEISNIKIARLWNCAFVSVIKVLLEKNDCTENTHITDAVFPTETNK